jgi:hypothetical protein
MAHEARYSWQLFSLESDRGHARGRTGRLSFSEGEGVGEGCVQRILRVSGSNPLP